MKSSLTLLFNCLFISVILAQPVNDDCSGLIDLGVVPFCPDSVFYTNQNATESDIGNDNIPMPGACGNNDITFVGNDVWFAFTTNDTTLNYTIDLTGITDGMGSNPLSNPQIMIYRGDCGFDDLALLACASADDGASLLDLDLVGLDPNTVYFIRINDWSSTANPNWGTFQLCIEEQDLSLNASASMDTICLGETVQLLVESGENFDNYIWTADNDPAFPQNTQNPNATPIQTTTYEVTAFLEGDNLIDNGDFELGNTGFETEYFYGPDSMPPGQWGVLSFEGAYDINSTPNTSHSNFANCPDHTTGTGNMMIINGADEENINIWCQTIPVLPNTDYLFSAWVSSLTFENPAVLQFSINGNLLSVPFAAPFGTCTWNDFNATWNSGLSTVAEICIVNQNSLPAGNDFALDDIAFHTIESITDSVTVYVSAPTVNITQQMNASCSGICNGSATAIVSGSISNNPVSYLWSNGMTSAAISGLCSGNYTVTITDGLACTAATSVLIEDAQQFNASAISLVIPCEISTVGTAEVQTSMGTAPFTYLWDNGETTAIAENLDEGLHSVTVTDINGCISIASVEIILTTEVLDVQIASDSDTICLGNSVSLNAVNPPPGVSLVWSTGASSESIDVDPASTTTYTLTASELGANLITNGDFEDGDVVFSSDYSVGDGGPWGPLSEAGEYLVTTDPNLAHINFNSCGDHTSGLGNMMVINGADVANANVWCQTVTVAPNTDYQFSTWIISAITENPAILQFSINGSLLGNPFQAPLVACEWQEFFEIWNSGNSTSAEICIVNQNTLDAGNDFALDDIALTPVCRSIAERTIVVTELETEITNQTNVDCDGTPGSAEVNVLNGTAPYTYLWDNAETGAIAVNLIAGSHGVTIMDSNGCESISEVFIEESTISIDSIMVEEMRCGVVGNDFIEIINGSISIFMNEGTAPFQYSLDNGLNFQDENFFTEIESGMYSILVEDALGCMITESVTLDDLNFPNPPEIIAESEMFCEDNETIQLSIPNVETYDSLLWTTGESGGEILVDSAGIYGLMVFNENNCPADAFITLLECGDYEIPNAFSPNGDGISDQFGIVSMGTVEVLKFEIFNRWGVLVHNKPSPWDGQYKNEPHPSDVLFYKILIKTPVGEILESGDVTLIR